MSIDATAIEIAVRQLYEARKAAREAKSARQKKAEELGRCKHENEGNPEDWGPCYGYQSLTTAGWCSVCKGKLPTWEDYRQKSIASASALRAVLRIAKSLPPIEKQNQ